MHEIKKNPGGAVRAAAGARSTRLATNKRTTAATQGTYVLRLRCQRGGDIRKLRLLLKALLRRHGLRCLSIEPEARP